MRLISRRLKLCCKEQSLLFSLLCMSFNPLPLTYTKSAQSSKSFKTTEHDATVTENHSVAIVLVYPWPLGMPKV